MWITSLKFGIALCLMSGSLVTLKAQQNADSDTSAITLEQVLEANRYPIELNNDKLEGEGGRKLVEWSKEATIITIGESHGTREIPALIEVLIRELQTEDEFDHLAIETSPWTVEQMTRKLKQGKGAYDEFIGEYPFAVPFYNWKNERELLYQAVQHSEARKPLWGLDQIFAFSTSLALDRLKELAPSLELLTKIEKIESTGESKSADDPRLQDLPSPMPAPVSVYEPEIFDSLASDFKEIEEALLILEELSKSIKIYRSNNSNNYKSNQIRSRYLRDNLRQAVKHQADIREDPPQVIVKVGARHAYRGITPNNSLDVGNLSIPLAREMGGKAFNVAILCGPGSNGRSFPSSSSDCWSHRLGETFKKLSDKGPVLFDLKQVHPKLHEEEIDAGEQLEKFLWGFDAVVLIPGTTAAVPVSSPLQK